MTKGHVPTRPVRTNYRYFTGIYHFFGCFLEWYGNRKSGMVFLIFGSTSSGQRWFAERRGIRQIVKSAGVGDPNPTPILREWGAIITTLALLSPVSCFHLATDSTETGLFCAGRRSFDNIFRSAPSIFDFWR